MVATQFLFGNRNSAAVKGTFHTVLLEFSQKQIRRLARSFHLFRTLGCLVIDLYVYLAGTVLFLLPLAIGPDGIPKRITNFQRFQHEAHLE
jgi:hypothetical protein